VQSGVSVATIVTMGIGIEPLSAILTM